MQAIKFFSLLSYFMPAFFLFWFSRIAAQTNSRFPVFRALFFCKLQLKAKNTTTFEMTNLALFAILILLLIFIWVVRFGCCFLWGLPTLWYFEQRKTLLQNEQFRVSRKTFSTRRNLTALKATRTLLTTWEQKSSANKTKSKQAASQSLEQMVKKVRSRVVCWAHD